MEVNIRIEHALKKYGDNVVIPDLSLDIRPGEFIGVIGSSGSGKSSLINLIPRFYDTIQGHI